MRSLDYLPGGLDPEVDYEEVASEWRYDDAELVLPYELLGAIAEMYPVEFSRVLELECPDEFERICAKITGRTASGEVDWDR